MVRQVLPLAISGKVSKGTDSPLQGRSCRPVAYQEHSYVRAPGRNDLEGIREIVDVLLGRDPTHVTDYHIVGRPAQLPAYVYASGPRGPKERAIDAALPQHQTLKAKALELSYCRLRRDVRFSRTVMKPSQISPDRHFRPADMVMVAVLVEIGVKT
jgi:hypothetical protein